MEGSIPQFVHGFGSREFEISYNECQGSNHLVLVFQVPSNYRPTPIPFDLLPPTKHTVRIIPDMVATSTLVKHVVTAYSLEKTTFEQYLMGPG